MMKERPILFSAQMVRAILAGRKTQTRRMMNPQPHFDADGGCWYPNQFQVGAKHPSTHYGNEAHFRWLPTDLSKYGSPGDRLWVKETHCFRSTEIDVEVLGREELPKDGRPWKSFGGHSLVPIYRATEEAELFYDDDPRPNCKDCEDGNPHGHWRPSIHMPRWASRITLEVTGMRVERLHDISEADAQAEGVDTAKESFRILWEKINGKESWATNPWVWVIEFFRIMDARA